MAEEASPISLSYGHVSLAECTSISLNMPKHSWKCLNKLLWLWQGSEYSWSSYMFDRLLKTPPVLNEPGLWIWHSCICKGYAVFRICLIIAPYPSIMPEYPLMFLDIREHDWILLNILDCAWKCRNKLFWVCQDSQYATI